MPGLHAGARLDHDAESVAVSDLTTSGSGDAALALGDLFGDSDLHV